MAERVKRVEIWKNTAGVTLSNSGNVFLEAGGQGRCFWVPPGDWTGLNGTRVTSESDSAQPNNTTSTMRGGPSLRQEHIHTIDLDVLGGGVSYDRMFVEWNGEITADATGFALDAAAPSTLARTWWYSAGNAWAAGSFTGKKPPVVCYNSNEAARNSCPMSGAVAGTAVEPQPAAGGFSLMARSWGDPSIAGGGDARMLYAQMQKNVLPFALGDGSSLSKAGMLWGYSAKSSGADISRYPKAGDQMGWIYEIGYPVGGGSFHQGGMTVSGYANYPELSITGLSKVWLAVWDTAPATGASSPYLNFTNASMSIRGTITLILLNDR